VLYKSLERTIKDGLKQTRAYMDRCDAEDGHLIIFDRRENISWDEKAFSRKETHQGQMISVWGM
jgi:hypothetical protein